MIFALLKRKKIIVEDIYDEYSDIFNKYYNENRISNENKKCN